MMPLLLALRLWCAIARPTSLTVPRSMWLPMGIRASGEFIARPLPVGDDAMTANGERDASVRPDGELEARVYCTGGSRAVIRDDGRTVGCQRGGYP